MKGQEYKPLPIGVDSFKDLRDNGYYYVDKTLMIKELLDLKGKVNLFTRPRRFGKTLNMTMLREFFQLPAGKSEAEIQDASIKQHQLFEGLTIMEAGEIYTSQMGQYPVIFLTLKSGKQPTWKLAYAAVMEEIQRAFDSCSFFLQSDRLSEADKERFLKIRNQRGTREVYQKSLQFLSDCMEKVHGRKAVLLIDEYDVPLENAYFCGFYEEMIGFLRSLFESALKRNESLAFAVMTGCLRISKESIFTGLNNLEMISIRNALYAEHFGFAQKEVDEMLRFYGCQDSREEARCWYDGYLFGDVEVYNPWSMINYVKQKYHNPGAFAAPYWANTSGNAIVRSLIENADLSVKEEIEGLIAGGSIEKPVHEDVTYNEMSSTADHLWNFLFFTGYLTKVSERKEGREIYMTMRIPNEEVISIYENHIRGWYAEKVLEADLSPLFKATLAGDAETMEREISRMLRESISYMDNKEAFHHGFLAGLYQGISREEYLLKSNRESCLGRYDLLLCAADYTRAILVELKVTEKKSDLEVGCDLALEQMREREYGRELLEDGYDEVTHCGIAFWRKQCRVKFESPGWKI